MKTLNKLLTVLGFVVVTLSPTTSKADDIEEVLKKFKVPEVKQERLVMVRFGNHPEGYACITLGYNTDDDTIEDVRFHYRVVPYNNNTVRVKMDGYAIDADRNHKFDNDEWVGYNPQEKGGHNL